MILQLTSLLRKRIDYNMPSMDKEFLATTLRIILLGISGFILLQLYSMNGRLTKLETQIDTVISQIQKGIK